MNSEKALDIGLLILRVGTGVKFLFHGYPKLTGGPEMWEGLGGAMANFGITFAPAFWGFMAASTEFFGGVLLIIGLLTRPAAALLAITMIVALTMHVTQGDPFRVYSHSAGMLVVFLALLFTGPGKFSLSAKLGKKYL